MDWTYEAPLAEAPTTTRGANARPELWQIGGIGITMAMLGVAAAFGFGIVTLFTLPAILEVLLVAWSLSMTVFTGRIAGRMFQMLKRKA